MERDAPDSRDGPDQAPASPPSAQPDDDEPASPSSKRSRKEKKAKKEKKHHKHKHRHKERRREKESSPEERAEGGAQPALEPDAAAPAGAAEAAAGAAAEQPLAPPANGDAVHEPPPGAAAADEADKEEGELPDALPPSARGARREADVDQPADRSRPARRSRSRSRTPDRGERDGRGTSERDRYDRGRTERSPLPGGGGGRRERSPRRERSEPRPAAVEERRRDERDRPGSRPRSPECGGKPRSPERSRPRSRTPERMRRERDFGRLPPRPYDRDRDRVGIDRRRGPDDWRRAEEERRRGGGWDEGRWGGYRNRSRSRSRDRRKRSRSGERGRQDRRRQEEEEEDVEEFQKRVAAALEGQEDEDEDRLIEERRRRRQEILAKHREQQALSENVTAPTATALQRNKSVNFKPEPVEGEAAAAAPAAAAAAPAAAGAPASAPPSTPPSPAREAAASPAPGAAGGGASTVPGTPEPGLSEDEEAERQAAGEGGVMDIWKHDDEEAAAAGAGEGVSGAQSAAGTKTGIGEDDGELAKRVAVRRNVDVDMFAEAEEDDIFAATPPEARAAAEAAAQGVPAAGGVAAPAAVRKGLLDNYDDAEGYYNFQVGEVVADKYEVVVSLGKGVFSSVLRARDTSRKDPDTGAHPEVAIKVIRANETMYKAGQMEKVILRKLSEADKEGRRHCIRMLSSFEYRNHLCLVFESLDLNLRELTKRYGRGIGLSINAVRIYAQQMLVALHHLKNCGVLHADIKPDNILVNDRRTVVKLCDFGSAMFTGDNEITPYLVSRFYRPPEVILGLPYDHPMDMWSVGCVVYELFTGRILFPGKTNNEMLKLMMDVKGPFPKKMVKKAEFGFKHFENDPNNSFALLEEDKVTKRPVRRLIPNPTIKADFAALLAGQSPDRRKLAQLADLLERMMALDPDKRISPKEALRHPFIKEPPTPPGGAAGAAKK